MKTRLLTIIAAITLVLLSGCEKGRFLSSINGAPYELLVVADKSMWNTASGKALFGLLEKDMPSMPQKEPYFSTSRCDHADFTSMLKPTRNILIVDINAKKYKHTDIAFSKNRWAKPQSVAKIVAPTQDSLLSLIETRGQEILDYFVQAELDREKDFLYKQSNAQLESMVYEMYNIQIKVPTEITQYKKDPAVNALWLSSGANDTRTDLIIYSYPYTDKAQLSLDSLMAKRDTVCRRLIPGPIDGSYMGTETKYDFPMRRDINKNGKYCAQITGLWRVFGKSMMGGPYISHTSIDQLHQQIVTVEGFVYAPQKNKRNLIRKMEAVLQTVQLPSFADDVTVTASK